MLVRLVVACLFAFSPAHSYSNDSQVYLTFFERYQTLAKNFDVGVTELYADDARITSVRKVSDSEEQTLRFGGVKWKQLITDSIEFSRQLGDINEFSGITVSIEEGTTNIRAKIRANRYSRIKCFNDSNYYMTLERRPGNEIKIVEEYMESPLTSMCEEIPEKVLTLLLQATTKYMENLLPIEIDENTSLEDASSVDRTLVLEYVLVNSSSTEIDSEAFAENTSSFVIQRTCSLPNFKPILDQGGTVSYRYLGKDRVPVLNVNVDKNSCI